MRKFKIGEEVVLTKLEEGRSDSPANPLWGGDEGYVKGEVIRSNVDEVGDIVLRIKWENSEMCEYDSSDGWEIKLYSEVKKEEVNEGKIEIDESKFGKLILDAAAKDEIISVLKQHKNAQKIFEEWGLGDIIEYGKGMTFLFYGPPGTGKTWGANCIAKSMNKELLTISASQIQTSEPGGANRNIENAFRAAQKEKKVLFFDECDSLITQRNDVGMILGSEINTLLTETEKFEGVMIMATNRIETLDEALERRISLIVEFPTPDFHEREEIWKTLVPKKLPLAKNIDLTKLAEYKLTGGQIKNVLLQAARFAASKEQKTVTLNNFETAVARVLKSKSLMGRSSRYRQIRVRDDVTVNTGADKKL